MVMAILKAIEE